MEPLPEIQVGPLTFWLAPVATAFPTVNTTPAVDWIKMGTEGAHNYDEDGVEVNQTQNVETFTGAASTFPRKAFRTEEGLAMAFTLVDLSPAQWAKVLDNATVTTVAAGVGTPGVKSFSMKRGLEVENYALLARGKSTVNSDLVMQLQWPTVFQSGDPSPQFSKGAPSGLELEFTALEVVPDQVGDVKIQTAAPTS